MTTYELYTVHHKNDPQIGTFKRFFYPVQAGASRNNIELGIIKDNENGTLSSYNNLYCEVSAFDEIFRRATSDYIGVMHYRRMLTTPNRGQALAKMLWRRCLRLTRKPKITIKGEFLITDHVSLQHECINLLNYFDKNLYKFDIITPYKIITYPTKMKDHYEKNHVPEHYYTFRNALISLNPIYRECFEKAENLRYGYFYNIFIMKRQIFYNYWADLSGALQETRLTTSVKNLNNQEQRYLGFLAERFMNVFLMKLHLENAKLLHKELPVANIRIA